MAATEPSIVIACPSCSARFAVPTSLAGRRARCAACESPFIVPAPPKSASAPSAPSHKSEDPAVEAPQHIGFECHLCGTRMYAPPRFVGKKVECPDCGAKTRIPPPPEPKRKNIPPALEGEQYELWDADDQPLPSDILAAQPKYISFQCRVCATLMHVNELQVGQQIACPDCKTKQPVPPKPKIHEQRSVLAPDNLTPRLDPAAAPGERPAFVSSGYRMMHEDRAEKEYAAALEKSQRTGKPMEIDVHGRPILPKWPLLSGILPFLFTSGVLVRWLGISVALGAAGWVLLNGLAMAMTGGFGAIAGMCFFAIGCVFTMLAASAAAGALLQIITESAVGNREIENWPSLLDWFGSLLFLGVSGIMSAVPGSAVSLIPPLHSNPSWSALAIGIGIAICWPVMILSQLHINSIWGIVSPRILGSLVQCPFSWALFFLETFALLAICGAAIIFIAGNNAMATLWLMPLFVAVMIILARLLGRLAWMLSEKISLNDPEIDDSSRPAMKNYNPPRPSKKTT
jgi:DNA-directed RNA polymerase subunit RPC12/RpoP